MATKTYIQEKLTGMPGQVVSFDINNKAIVKSLDPILGATLYVTAQYGATVTASDGLGVVTASNSPQLFVPSGSDSLTTSDGYTLYSASDNVYEVKIPRVGIWVVNSTAAGVTLSKIITINGPGDFYLTLSPFEAYISVKFPMESTCICSDGTTILTATNTDGFYIFEVPNPGTWTVTAYNATQSKTRKVDILSAGQEEAIEVKWIDPILEYNDWATIQRVTQLGTATLYWSVGDCKAITLNGTIDYILNRSHQDPVVRTTTASFDNQIVYAFILGFDHNADRELRTSSYSSSVTPGITFQIGKTARTSGTDICLTDSFYGINNNDDGTYYNAFNIYPSTSDITYQYSFMRITICGNYRNQKQDGSPGIQSYQDACVVGSSELKMNTTFKDIVDEDLVSVLRTANKSGAGYDYFYLPSRQEILGDGYPSGTTDLQFNYYVNNSQIKYKDVDNTTAATWWLRNSGEDSNYVGIIDATGTYRTARSAYSYGFAPCFTVG